MELYTIQLSQWRKAKELGVPVLNTTVKNGNKAFAPSWDIVVGVKAGSLSEEAYRERYIDHMRSSWSTHRDEWEKLLAMPVVALGCFCRAGEFCHRHLLKEIVEKILENRGRSLVDHGEIQ